MEAPTPMSVYDYTGLAVLLTGVVGFGLMKKAENERRDKTTA